MLFTSCPAIPSDNIRQHQTTSSQHQTTSNNIQPTSTADTDPAPGDRSDCTNARDSARTPNHHPILHPVQVDVTGCLCMSSQSIQSEGREKKANPPSSPKNSCRRSGRIWMKWPCDLSREGCLPFRLGGARVNRQRPQEIKSYGIGKQMGDSLVR